MMRERVELGDRSYDIVIGPGLLRQTGDLLQELGVKQSSRHLLVTDEHVRDAGHLETVQAAL
ncbi:MAG: 3-dehydroquinate synthase, partial [Tumebacillaceae bacterium]